jgi:hypothetical protein
MQKLQNGIANLNQLKIVGMLFNRHKESARSIVIQGDDDTNITTFGTERNDYAFTTLSNELK